MVMCIDLLPIPGESFESLLCVMEHRAIYPCFYDDPGYLCGIGFGLCFQAILQRFHAENALDEFLL